MLLFETTCHHTSGDPWAAVDLAFAVWHLFSTEKLKVP